MSYTQVIINNSDVTKYVTQIGSLREWNDESNHFAGVFRRGNLTIELDNTSDLFNRNSNIFQGSRNEKIVSLTYYSSDPTLNSYRTFAGVIDEGSTENNLEERTIQFTILDYLKLLDSKVIKIGDQIRIDSLYRTLRGGSSRLNKHFLACFLYYFLRQDDNKLNKIFNVFDNNALISGSYPTINATIESIFPPSDDYYDTDNVSSLNVLNELCKSTNSYLYVETLEDKSRLFIKARPNASQSSKTIRDSQILNFTTMTDGFNKLYNSISINESRAYVNQSSIDQYGVRPINIESYSPASQTLANAYLDYYAQPKSELNAKIKLTNEGLDIKVGDVISLDVPSRPDLTVQGIKGKYFVLSREVIFSGETINLRLRGV